MRALTVLVVTLVLVVAAIGAYDALHSPPEGARGQDPALARLRARLEGIEARLRGLSADLEGLPGAAERPAGSAPAVRLHDAQSAPALDEAEVARWAKGLDDLAAQRLREDEQRYVERRLGELELGLTPAEHADATRIVLAYLRAKAQLWRSFESTIVHPEKTKEVYDALARAHHKQLASAIGDPSKGRAIAAALIPLR